MATLKTILFVEVIPWFVLSFASGILISLLLVPAMMGGSSRSPMKMMIWFPLVFAMLSAALSLAKDAVFVVWSRRKLDSEFRERAAQALVPIHSGLPPPLPKVGEGEVAAQPADPG